MARAYYPCDWKEIVQKSVERDGRSVVKVVVGNQGLGKQLKVVENEDELLDDLGEMDLVEGEEGHSCGKGDLVVA